MSRYRHSLSQRFSSRSDTLAWLDTIPLSRSVHNLETDFADGLLVAEVVAHFFPEYVDFNIFRVARNMAQRVKNWRLLNTTVLLKIDMHTPGGLVHDIVNEHHRSIDLFLDRLREKLDELAFRAGRQSPYQYHSHRYHLPRIHVSPRRSGALVPSYGTLPRSSRVTDATESDLDELVRAKDEEIDVLRAKLKRCERTIHKQEGRIEDLQNKIDKLKLQ